MSWHKEQYDALVATAKTLALAHLQVLAVAAVFVLAFFLGRCSV